MRISILNESNVILYFSDTVDASIIVEISAFQAKIKAAYGSAIIDSVASYASLLLHVDIFALDICKFAQEIEALWHKNKNTPMQNIQSKMIEIPVYYGSEVALDAQEVSQTLGLDFADVIQHHQAQIYHVYAIGFAPAFAYLGKTNSEIHIARKSTPRTQVPAKSIGLADWQTAIYPKASPGGWQIIGRTPMEMLDLSNKNLTQLMVGDAVKFVSITKDEFINLGGEI